jgi:hypothetical protein
MLIKNRLIKAVLTITNTQRITFYNHNTIKCTDGQAEAVSGSGVEAQVGT